MRLANKAHSHCTHTFSDNISANCDQEIDTDGRTVQCGTASRIACGKARCSVGGNISLVCLVSQTRVALQQGSFTNGTLLASKVNNRFTSQYKLYYIQPPAAQSGAEV